MTEAGPASNPTPAPPTRRLSGIVVPHQPKWYQWLAAWLVYALVQTVAATLRFRVTDRSDYFDVPPSPQPRPVIVCVWHNRLALSIPTYDRHIRPRNLSRGMAAMVSASKDGGLLAAILECFNVEPVRGSSSRRGPQALLELTTWSERGYDLAITPDGPRGPRYTVQHGVMSLAQVTGLPIIPASWHLHRKIVAKSWDGFQIPLPFTRCDVIIEKPIVVPREASDDEREQLRVKLEETLKSITRD